MAKRKKIVRPDRTHGVKAGGDSPAKATPPEKPGIPERIREKDSGFGVIKGVVGVIIALILGSTVLYNTAGGRQSERGNKAPGEPCGDTVECRSGTICYMYSDLGRQCMETCYDGQCSAGFHCVAAATQKRRKGLRITDVCVRDGTH